MSELITNLQAIYNAKLDIKAALETQSDELADYAGYITALKPDGYTYLTENGDYDVSGYEYAYVNVPSQVVEGSTYNMNSILNFDPSGSFNGLADVTSYENAEVNFNIDQYITTGYNVTENGTHNILTYAYVVVDVPTGGGGETIYLDNIGLSEVINLDGMNNRLYHSDWNAYAVTTQVFTQEYPTAGYLYLIPDTLGISKDENVNAYLFEPTALSQREFSYTEVQHTIEEADSYVGTVNELETFDLMKARITFKYNPNRPKVASTRNGVTQPGPWGADGINTIMNYTTINGINVLTETLSNKQELYTALLDSGINLTNFGSYVLIPTKDYWDSPKSQYKYTASNAYATIYPDNGYPLEGEMNIMDMLNHKTYDCILQRTSYKGGFTANKYETVLVDTYNYVGELQQTEIKGVRYGTGNNFYWSNSTNTYYYYMSIPANGQIQARTTYFELTTDGSTWNKFNFCEDMVSVSAQDYVTFKLGSTISGGNTTYYLVPSTISNYANVPSRLPSNYFRNGQNDSLDIKIRIDKDTWKVNYEFYPKEGVYMKLYDSRGQFEYIKSDASSNQSDGGDDNWTECYFEYDKTKGSGYTFVFVKFDNNAIIGYCSHLDNGNINIWEYNDSAACPVTWGNTEPTGRFNYPTQSDVDDTGVISVTYGDKEVAWMNIGSGSESESES